MIPVLDLLLLLAVSACYSIRHAFLGVVIFAFGLFFVFQARRSRFLVGLERKPASTARRLRAAAAAILLAATASPLVGDPAAKRDFFEAGHQLDVWFPVVIVIGFLSAALMTGLSVEGRKR